MTLGRLKTHMHYKFVRAHCVEDIKDDFGTDKSISVDANKQAALLAAKLAWDTSVQLDGGSAAVRNPTTPKERALLQSIEDPIAGSECRSVDASQAPCMANAASFLEVAEKQGTEPAKPGLFETLRV